ncbi:30S ribosomal protein S1 [Candidatus Shapirobacteria bacterium]|nr:30S ribosomal protein S1 [Candidatus Shapirobacteria bacterium]
MSKVQKTKKSKVKASITPKTMEELLSLSSTPLKTFSRGEFVIGTVVEMRPKTLFLDIGGKTEGIITGKELGLVSDFASQLKVGDKIKVQIRVLENERGQTLLSLRKTAFEQSWQFFQKSLKEKSTVKIKGKEVNRGGVVVIAPFGLFGFIPGSQIGKKFEGDPANLVGRQVEARVLEVDQTKNRLVFSERMVSEPKVVAKEKKMMEDLKEGKEFEAKIMRVEPFGLFITISIKKEELELEGLVHISEVSWEKVAGLNRIYKAGDKVKVVLLNKIGEKLQFSIKRLITDPWADIKKKYPPETSVSGKIVEITNFGALVNLEPGIEGLIHISKIPPTTILKAGEKVKCFIEHVDQQRRRLSLELAPTSKPIGYK